MAQTNVNFRMDSDLKREMEYICKELGLNMTTAFTIFAKKVIREKRIPFDISIDPSYSGSAPEPDFSDADLPDNYEGQIDITDVGD